ncbi:MAG: hypothetical protein ACXABD_15765 [Candidatus Thorarchaeota archaeon]|jgi:hypothetical protein
MEVTIAIPMEIGVTETQIYNAINLLCDGINTDGGHHKQWYLVNVLRALVGDSLMDPLFPDGFDPGITP